jgi:hypothetical protein
MSARTWGLGVLVSFAILSLAAPPARAVVSAGIEVDASDIGYSATFIPAGVVDPNPHWIVIHTFIGSFSTGGPGFTVAGSGKPIAPIDVNLSGDTAFEYTMSAPAGMKFQVNVPAGHEGAGFGGDLMFGNHSVTLLQSEDRAALLDGVAVPGFLSDAVGVDPGGQAILIGSLSGPNPPEFPTPFDFASLTFRVDYAELTLTGNAPQLLAPREESSVHFVSVHPVVGPAPGPFITVQPVPEPAALGVAFVAAAAMLARRRQTRR